MYTSYATYSHSLKLAPVEFPALFSGQLGRKGLLEASFALLGMGDFVSRISSITLCDSNCELFVHILTRGLS